jgi:hypothetical protein
MEKKEEDTEGPEHELLDKDTGAVEGPEDEMSYSTRILEQ